MACKQEMFWNDSLVRSLLRENMDTFIDEEQWGGEYTGLSSLLYVKGVVCLLNSAWGNDSSYEMSVSEDTFKI